MTLAVAEALNPNETNQTGPLMKSTNTIKYNHFSQYQINQSCIMGDKRGLYTFATLFIWINM